MKTLALAVLSLMCISTAASAQSNGATASTAKQQIVGTWRLVSIEDTAADGTSGPDSRFGPHAKGYLMYEADGHMCAEIMRPDRAFSDAAHPTEKEKADAYDGFIGYCGTYDFNADETTVTHHPDVAMVPPYVGTLQPRPFRLVGDRLIITVTTPDQKVVKHVLTWERAR